LQNVGGPFVREAISKFRPDALQAFPRLRDWLFYGPQDRESKRSSV